MLQKCFIVAMLAVVWPAEAGVIRVAARIGKLAAVKAGTLAVRAAAAAKKVVW